MVKVVKTEGTWTHFVARMTEKQNLIDYLVIINFGHSLTFLLCPRYWIKFQRLLGGGSLNFYLRRSTQVNMSSLAFSCEIDHGSIYMPERHANIGS